MHETRHPEVLDVFHEECYCGVDESEIFELAEHPNQAMDVSLQVLVQG